MQEETNSRQELMYEDQIDGLQDLHEAFDRERRQSVNRVDCEYLNRTAMLYF